MYMLQICLHIHTLTHTIIRLNIIVCKLIDSNADFIFYLGQIRFFLLSGKLENAYMTVIILPKCLDFWCISLIVVSFIIQFFLHLL